MRLYLGHRLPLGFYGAAGFGRYGPRPTHVVHEDGSTTPVRGPSLFWTAFWFGVMAVPVGLVIWAYVVAR